MIRINQDIEQTLLIPRNTEGIADTLEIHSEISQRTYTFNVTDDGAGRYYKIMIDADEIPEGEYNYTLLNDEGTEIALGLLQVGEAEEIEKVIFYKAEIEYIQYTPKKKVPWIRISGDTSIGFDTTEIHYGVRANEPWAQTIYRKEGEGEWTQFGETTYHQKGTHSLTLPVSANSSPSKIYYWISVGLDDNTTHADLYVEQDKEYFTVYCQTAENIAASATEISYSVSFNWYNSYRTGTTYLYKDGELLYETDFGRYPYGFSSYYEIPANTSFEPVNYEFKVVMPATPNEPMTSAHSFTTQEAYEAPEQTYLIMSASSYSLAAEDTSLSWSYSANTNWTLTATSPWGTGISQKTVGSGTSVFYFEQNTTASARTFTYQGQTADGQASQTLTFVQAASAVTPTPSGYTSTRFSVEMLEDGDIIWNGNGSTLYKINGGETQSLSNSILGLSEGDVVEFFVSADTTNTFSMTGFTATGKHNLIGNIMSLFYADYENVTTLPISYAFQFLFRNDTNLVNAENLILPATALTASCYDRMFQGCTSLTKAPELPARELVTYAYFRMFEGCTKLNYMKSYATVFPSSDLGIETSCWLKDVSSTGDFWAMSNANWLTGENGIPTGWTRHNIDR